MARKSGINIKKSRQGLLRKKTRTKKGKKIPLSTLRKMKNSRSPKARRQANFALNARKWKKGKRK